MAQSHSGIIPARCAHARELASVFVHGTRARTADSNTSNAIVPEFRDQRARTRARLGFGARYARARATVPQFRETKARPHHRHVLEGGTVILLLPQP